MEANKAAAVIQRAFRSGYKECCDCGEKGRSFLYWSEQVPDVCADCYWTRDARLKYERRKRREEALLKAEHSLTKVVYEALGEDVY